MDYRGLVEQNKQYNSIISDFNNGKVNHAYLLVSADTSYLEAMCYSLASKILNCSQSKIAKNIHPDCFIIGELGKIDVANINSITSNLIVAPYEADYKLYIIQNAENMSETCQNKLLKSLEEPPKNVIFLLTCSTTKQILSTILSRVKLLNIDNLNSQDIINLLVKTGATAEAASIAVSCSNNNSTLASKLLNKSFFSLYNYAFKMLESINGSKDCLSFVSELDGKEIDKAELLDIIIILLRDIACVLSNTEELIINKYKIDDIKQISYGYKLSAISKLIDVCTELKEDLFYNANSSAVLDRLLLVIAEEKAKCRK